MAGQRTGSRSLTGSAWIKPWRPVTPTYARQSAKKEAATGGMPFIIVKSDDEADMSLYASALTRRPFALVNGNQSNLRVYNDVLYLSESVWRTLRTRGALVPAVPKHAVAKPPSGSAPRSRRLCVRIAYL